MLPQACRQYNVNATNSSITIFYSDNTKENFSSFEKFSLLSMAHASPIQNIVLSYKISIPNHSDGKPELYSININIYSRIVIQKKISDDLRSQMPFVLVRVTDYTIVVEIKYADDNIAKALVSIITDWESVLPCAPKNSVMLNLQKFSHFIPRVSKILITIFAIITIIYITPLYFDQVGKNVDSNLSALCIFILASSGTIYIINALST
jgi:hypothetical protein